jgi:hypothetical protein
MLMVFVPRLPEKAINVASLLCQVQNQAFVPFTLAPVSSEPTTLNKVTIFQEIKKIVLELLITTQFFNVEF